jgi:unsaturated rhamnogalacturonyl hydrolase
MPRRRPVDAVPGRDTGIGAKEVLQRVAQRTLRFDFSVWFWGDAIAFDGLLDAAVLLEDPAYSRYCTGFFERWQARPPSWTDYLAPGLALARLIGGGATGLTDLAKRLFEHYLVHTPRGPSGLHYFRPDLPQFRTTLLIDSLYHVPSFVAACARVLGDAAAYDEGLSMWHDHARVLSLPGRPLLFHNYDHGSGRRRGYGWGRGNGWAILGLLDLIEQLPTRHQGHQTAVDEFRRLAAAILPLQDESGFWRTLLDDRESYLESSTAAFYGAAFTKSVALGLLSDAYGDAANRAWRALLSRIDDEGGVFGTSAATWAATAPVEDLALYKAAPTEVNVWGQGAALRFAAERIRAGKE